MPMGGVAACMREVEKSDQEGAQLALMR
jgi:hypothetical protein